MNDPSTNSLNNTYTRSTGEKLTFWLLWILLLIPLIITILLALDANDMFGALLLIPILAQILIHTFAAWLFFNTNKPFSSSLLWLLGATSLIFMLLVGGCFVAVFGYSNLNMH